jgi:hypothetical protein
LNLAQAFNPLGLIAGLLIAQQFIIELKTDRLAKNVFLSTNSTHNFSDNYSDMIPNSKKTVIIKKDQSDDLESFNNNNNNNDFG